MAKPSWPRAHIKDNLTNGQKEALRNLRKEALGNLRNSRVLKKQAIARNHSCHTISREEFHSLMKHPPQQCPASYSRSSGRSPRKSRPYLTTTTKQPTPPPFGHFVGNKLAELKGGKDQFMFNPIHPTFHILKVKHNQCLCVSRYSTLRRQIDARGRRAQMS